MSNDEVLANQGDDHRKSKLHPRKPGADQSQPGKTGRSLVQPATILSNQRTILTNQEKLDTVITNQERNLANQEKILSK